MPISWEFHVDADRRRDPACHVSSAGSAMSAPVVPHGDKKLRACLVTGLIKTEDQVRRPRAQPVTASTDCPVLSRSGWQTAMRTLAASTRRTTES